VQEGGFTGIVPSQYTHLDLSSSQFDDDDMLMLSTAMYPDFTKIPGLVRVNRFLQVRLLCSLTPCFFSPALKRCNLQAAWKEESRYISRIFDWLFDIWCFSESLIFLAHILLKRFPLQGGTSDELCCGQPLPSASRAVQVSASHA
jgi:hypothetical protein